MTLGREAVVPARKTTIFHALVAVRAAAVGSVRADLRAVRRLTSASRANRQARLLPVVHRIQPLVRRTRPNLVVPVRASSARMRPV